MRRTWASGSEDMGMKLFGMGLGFDGAEVINEVLEGEPC